MKTKMTRRLLCREELLSEIQPILAECCDCKTEAVIPTANFFDDLGGDSLDIEDLFFGCERRLGLRIPIQELQDPSFYQFDTSGRLKPESLAQLKIKFPGLDLSDLESATGPFHPHDVLTVDRIVQLIDQAQRQTGGVVSTTNSSNPSQ